MGDGLWVMGYGLWVMGDGLWVMGYGLWVMGDGLWVTGDKTNTFLPRKTLKTPKARKTNQQIFA